MPTNYILTTLVFGLLGLFIGSLITYLIVANYFHGVLYRVEQDLARHYTAWYNARQSQPLFDQTGYETKPQPLFDQTEYEDEQTS